MKHKRLRLLIYEAESKEQMDRQIAQDTKSRRWGSGEQSMALTSIELNPLRITILELLRLFRREQK